MDVWIMSPWSCVLHNKWENQNFGGFLLGSPRIFCHFNAPLPFKKYYKEENGISSQIRIIVCHVNVCFSLVNSCIIFITICINYLFFFGFCKLTSWTHWACEFVLIPSKSSHALFFFVKARECALSLHFIPNLGNGKFFTPKITWQIEGCIICFRLRDEKMWQISFFFSLPIVTHAWCNLEIYLS